MVSNSFFIGWKCTVLRATRLACTPRAAVVLLAAICSALLPSPSRAQSPRPSGRHEIFAGSEIENYLRYLQSLDTVATRQWSLRPFSPSQVDAILSEQNAFPWTERFDLGGGARPSSEVELIPPTVSARFNTGFPYGSNDGPIWAGRGLTTSAQAGVFARFGPLSITLAPMVFRAENASFAVAPAGRVCPPACADPQFPLAVDRPQRFGNSAYQRFDPGQSTIRLDATWASAGVSTANEWWGPAQLYPFLLGNNAPGFPHAFVGTNRSLPVLIGRLSARVIYGRLEQSAYSPVKGSQYATGSQPGEVRFASGVITTFEPNGLTGLELGFGRFFDSSWPASGIPRSYFTRPLRGPFQGFYESGGSSTTITSNQLASAFARWVFPHDGLEIYGEYGAEDSHADFRGAIQELDYTRAYSLGLRKVFHPSPTAFSALHFELMNYQLPGAARFHGGAEGVIYMHNGINQGHTNRGQLLASALGVGAAAGSTVQWDRYSLRGRTSIAWIRTVNEENGTFYLNGKVNPRSSDVSHALRIERVAFLRRFDVTSGLTLVREFNRNFSSDAWNLNALLMARYRLP